MNLSHDKMPIDFVKPPSSANSEIQQLSQQRRPQISKPVEVGKKYGRNDKVKISNGAETKIIKYKKAESLIKEGWNIIE